MFKITKKVIRICFGHSNFLVIGICLKFGLPALPIAGREFGVSVISNSQRSLSPF
jgi:hypothetical protein